MRDEEEALLDACEGRLVPPYMATGGRTQPSVALDLLTQVRSTGTVDPRHIDPHPAEVLLLCNEARSIAEISAHQRLPAMAVKVLVSDLIGMGAVHTVAPHDYSHGQVPVATLQAILDGLQRRL